MRTMIKNWDTYSFKIFFTNVLETLVDSIFEAAMERDPRKNQTTICGSIASSTASSPAQSDFFATNFNLE